MRKMRTIREKHRIEINVIEHIMVRKILWEYYITDNKYSDDIVCALVVGHEVELGDVSLEEIRPYIITRTKDLSELAPAPGWEWVDTYTTDQELG